MMNILFQSDDSDRSILNTKKYVGGGGEKNHERTITVIQIEAEKAELWLKELKV